MNQNLHFKKGWTLIELLMAIGLIGLVATLAIGVYYSHYKIYSNQSAIIDTSSQATLSVDEIANNAREADSVVNTCTGCGSDSTSSQVLILQLWPVDSNGIPEDPGATNYDYIIYKKSPADPTKLVRKTVPSAISKRPNNTVIIATNINTLQFTYNNATYSLANLVTVQINTKSTSLNKQITSTQQKTSFIRNR